VLGCKIVQPNILTRRGCLLRLEAINRAAPLSLYGSAHGCRSASCSRTGLYFVFIEGRVLRGGILRLYGA